MGNAPATEDEIKFLDELCKEMYEKYIRDIITFAMPKPDNKFKTTLLNAFLENDKESLTILNDGLNCGTRIRVTPL